MANKANPLQVLVVDDTAIYRKIIVDTLEDIPGIEVVGTATNGRDALEKVLFYRPDLLTLDLEMPEMNGLEVLEHLQTTAPDICTIMISSHTKQGGEMTIKALNRGAFDFILKPENLSVDENRKVIKEQLGLILDGYRFCKKNKSNIIERRKTNQESVSERPLAKSYSRRQPAPGKNHSEIIAIGISTGGPMALMTLLSNLPKDLPVPILIAQHMPSGFTESLAKSLDRKCALDVCEAKHKDLLCPGRVFLAPGGSHMKIENGPVGIKHLSITKEETGSVYKPSINLLFRSVAEHFGANATGVIMTGMGSDGLQGLKTMKREGATIIAQDQESCVIYGMPAVAVEAGITDQIVSLPNMADAIVSTLGPAKG